MTTRFAIFGTGFWSRFQLAGWRELEGVECVALCNRTRSKAEMLAREFGVPAVYDDPEELLRHEKIDFMDIIAHEAVHASLVELAVKYRLPVICQKPMASDLETAQAMVAACREAGIPFMIHENWRWQPQIRRLKELLQENEVGRPFRGHIVYANSFPVFERQPFLKELQRFILTDMGSHILDTVRFLFGEARTVYCHMARVNADIQGEDVATLMLEMKQGMTVLCSLSYASRVEHDRYNETYALVECQDGCVELGPDYWIRLTTRQGTLAKRYPPHPYAWADPLFEMVHASIVPCNADLLRSIRTGEPAQTSGEDNLETMRLVFAAYQSAQTGQVISL